MLYINGVYVLYVYIYMYACAYIFIWTYISNSKLRETIEGTNVDIPSEIKDPHTIAFTVLCDQYTHRLSKNIIFETER